MNNKSEEFNNCANKALVWYVVVVAVVIAACALLSGCASDEDTKKPDLGEVSSTVDQANNSAKQAANIVAGTKATVSSVVKNGAKPNDAMVLKLQADLSQVSLLLADTMSKLDHTTSLLTLKQTEVDKVAQERDDWHKSATKAEANLDTFMKTAHITNIIIAVLAVIFFLAGYLATEFYASQIVSIIPVVGNITASLLALIGGGIGVSVFLFLLVIFQSPIGGLIRFILSI